jgi:chromosome partitioning protein
VIDTAPYLGLVTINALCASHQVLVPVSCEYLPLLGLKLFSETMSKIRARLGAPLEILGYLLTLYDRRQRITLEVEQILRRTFGDKILPHPIRINTHLKAAPSHKKAIYDFESPGGKGRVDYQKLTREVMQRLSLTRKAQKRKPAPLEVTAIPPAMHEEKEPAGSPTGSF